MYNVIKKNIVIGNWEMLAVSIFVNDNTTEIICPVFVFKR